MQFINLTPDDAIQYVLGEDAETTPKTFEQWSKLCHQNLGQLWYDLLDMDDKVELMCSPWDPYQAKRWEEILISLAFLKNHEFYKSVLLTTESANQTER